MYTIERIEEYRNGYLMTMYQVFKNKKALNIFDKEYEAKVYIEILTSK